MLAPQSLSRDLNLLPFFAVFGAGALARRGRTTHTRGVAAKGTFTVAQDLDHSLLRFFAPGRVFRATLRHGNVSYDDDAAMDIRGAALRLECDHGAEKQSLDLLMNTGEVAFPTARVFLDFARASAPKPFSEGPVDVRGLRGFLTTFPAHRRQFVAGLRRAPTSYARLRYHSQIVFQYAAIDERERYARFRLVPAGLTEADEEGIPTPEDLEEPWLQDRHIGETRDFGYLREEFRARVAQQGVRYTLQVQLYAPERHADESMFDPGARWDEAKHPWHDVGELALRKPLGQKKTEELAFNVANLPPDLGHIPCTSLDDFGSIPYVRTRVYAFTQALRATLRRAKRLTEFRRQKRKRKFRSTKHLTKADKRRDSSLVHLVFGHIWRG